MTTNPVIRRELIHLEADRCLLPPPPLLTEPGDRTNDDVDWYFLSSDRFSAADVTSRRGNVEAVVSRRLSDVVC